MREEWTVRVHERSCADKPTTRVRRGEASAGTVERNTQERGALFATTEQAGCAGWKRVRAKSLVNGYFSG